MGACQSACQGAETGAKEEKVEVPLQQQPVAGTNAEEMPPKEEEPIEVETPVAKLTIMIMGARGLRNADWLPGTQKSDTYATVKIKDKDDCLFQTKTINNTLNPIWREETEFDFVENDDLEFSVWDEVLQNLESKVVLKNDNFVGKGFNGEVQLEDAEKDIKAYLRVKVKMNGMADYPQETDTAFTIEFDKDPKAKALGLDMDDTDGKYIYVTNVNAGPFKKYNDNAAVHEQLRSGDFLVNVNGKEGNSKEMSKELKSKKNFKIITRHPEEFTIAIDKKNAKALLGLDFHKFTGNALLINKVNDGPFKAWNDAYPEHKVQANDRIVSVAGIQDKAGNLQKQMSSLTHYQMIIRRPFPLSLEQTEGS